MTELFILLDEAKLYVHPLHDPPIRLCLSELGQVFAVQRRKLCHLEN